MSRDHVGLGGCGVVLLGFVLLFALSAIAQRDGDYQKARALFALAGIVLLGGALAVGGYYAYGVWRQGQDIEEGRKALHERADKLRRERDLARQRVARAAATQPGPPPTVTVPKVPGKPQVTAAAPAARAAFAKPSAVRAVRNLSMCPLCQTKIVAGEKYVACPACSASYHEDCWDYNGGCAVFGCAAGG